MGETIPQTDSVKSKKPARRIVQQVLLTKLTIIGVSRYVVIDVEEICLPSHVRQILLVSEGNSLAQNPNVLLRGKMERCCSIYSVEALIRVLGFSSGLEQVAPPSSFWDTGTLLRSSSNFCTLAENRHSVLSFSCNLCKQKHIGGVFSSDCLVRVSSLPCLRCETKNKNRMITRKYRQKDASGWPTIAAA